MNNYKNGGRSKYLLVKIPKFNLDLDFQFVSLYFQLL